jgi:hypothetical protein
MKTVLCCGCSCNWTSWSLYRDTHIPLPTDAGDMVTSLSDPHYVLSPDMREYRRGLHWWMDLLTIHAHDWEVQVITAPPLISAIHKSPQHPLSLFQPAVTSPVVPWQRFLTVEILKLHAFRSSCHNLPCRIQLNWLCPLLITSRHRPHKKHCCQQYLYCMRIRCHRNVFIKPLCNNGRGADHKKTPFFYWCVRVYAGVN